MRRLSLVALQKEVEEEDARGGGRESAASSNAPSSELLPPMITGLEIAATPPCTNAHFPKWIGKDATRRGEVMQMTEEPRGGGAVNRGGMSAIAPFCGTTATTLSFSTLPVPFYHRQRL